MDRINIVLVVLYTLILTALSVNIGLLFFAFMRNERNRALSFALLAGALIFYTLGYFLEIRATTAGEAMMALRVENIGIPSVAPIFLLTSLTFFQPRMLRSWMVLITLAYGLTMALIISFNEMHYIYYSSITMVHNGYFYVTVLGKGPLYFVQQGISMVCMLTAYTLLMARFIKGSAKLRGQMRLFMIGTLFGFMANIVNLVGSGPLGIDMTPFGMTIGMIFFAIVLYQHKLMDVVPAAFNMAVDTMDDALFVLDTDWGFIYCNQKAMELFPVLRKYSGTELITQVPEWPVELGPDGERSCIFSMEDSAGEKIVLQRAVVGTIHGKNGNAIGVMINFHDVTEITEMLNQLEAQAITDPLTGVYNRRYFSTMVEQQMIMASRHKWSLGILLLDIDHFKIVNDVHGHLAGDHVLVSVVQAVVRQLRAHDIMARYGGEEFVILSVEKKETDLLAFGNRLRKVVENERILFNGKEIKVTASFGAIMVPPNHTYKAVMESVDKAMYKAKDCGRNQVILGTIEEESQD